MKLACRWGRTALVVALAIVAAPSAACGRKGRAAARHPAAEASPAAAPTPDNTPVPALRTPAGLVLKLDEPAAAPPAPSAATQTPTPLR
jgi:hypothetical protein